MKKRLMLISILALSASVAFAQEIPVSPPIPETQGSVKKAGSAYVFGTETDAISAGSVYDLGRSFFSLGHTPSNAKHMSVFDLGVAITPLTFLGVAGGFNISTAMTEPSFFSTIAFGLNKKFGFHYNVAHAAVKNDTSITPTGKTDGSVWLHQVSFAMRISESLKYTIPVGVVINNSETTTDTAGITTVANSDKIILFLNPNFTMYPDSGVVSQFKAGVEVDFAVLNDIGKSKTTSASGTVTETKKNTDSMDILWRLYATPTFSWRFLDNQFRFMFEPTVAFVMRIESDGRPANASSTPITTKYTMTPSISAPVGIAFKPAEWFEFRSGLLYNLNCKIINTNTTGGAKTSDHDFYSSVMVFAGFGFIIANDFLIDIAFSSGVNEFNLNALSLQLTYNF